MNELAHKIKYNFKQNALQFGVFLVRLLTGAFVGVTLAMIVQTMLASSGIFLFMFVVISTMGIILRFTSDWGMLSCLILLLVFMLIGVLLKLYIHTAAMG